MSVRFWWFGFFITDEDHARLLPAFEAARLGAAAWRVEHSPVIEDWRAHPKSFEITARKDVNPFQTALNYPGFDDLMKAFLIAGGEFTYLLMEETTLRASLSRSPPVAMLWHALGYERAAALPGDTGNLLVAPSEVLRTAAVVSDAYRGLDLSAAVDNGARYCIDSNSDDDISEVITFLPDGLQRARELGRGFIALAPGVW